jgi:hypothetical protein
LREGLTAEDVIVYGDPEDQFPNVAGAGLADEDVSPVIRDVVAVP